MKQKVFSTFFCLLLCFSIPLSAAAAELQDVQYVVDNANILSYDAQAKLDSVAAQLSQTYSIDIFIVTTSTLNGIPAWEYAEGLYDSSSAYWDGSCWDSDNAILFLLAMEEREWYISTAGEAIYAFTDYGLESLESEVIPYLSEGSYFEGFSIYLEEIPLFLDAYKQGSPIDGYASDYDPHNADNTVYYQAESGISILLSIAIGLISAAVTILVMRGMMNTKNPQYAARDYMQPGSYQLTRHTDLFLYSNVTKVRRQENTSRNGGGSTVHRSSGGRSHGGRGGKF